MARKSMNFLTRYNLTPSKVLKLAGVFVLALFVLALVLQILKPSLNVALQGFSHATPPSMGMGGGMGMDAGYATNYDYAVKSEMAIAPGSPTLSVRNMMPYPMPGQTVGNNAEEFEVTDYNAFIETRNLEKTCDTVVALKAKSYVIFENANTYDEGCSYSFKVEHAHVDEIVAAIKALDPKDFSENTYTIKRQIDDFTSETDILEKKRASIDETLRSALIAYDEITRLATQTQDAEALARIIDSKLQIIERLTQERISINEQLDRLSRAKAEQLDRLEYTYFSINVVENKYLDWQNLKDSWKAAIRDVVRIVNDSIQGVTINLLALLFLVFQYALYALLLVILAKYGWKVVRYIWER